MTITQRFDTVIVGGGQAGLATGYHLARAGREFVILDAHPRVGDAWRRRWDSLTLFTPARRDGLPGLPFPAPKHAFITKDAMAAYLEDYAAHFDLPVRTGVRVDALGRERGAFIVAAGEERYLADSVVLACGAFQEPWTPPFAPELDPRIVQLHSASYRNPGQLQPGRVLVVGFGNSGTDIALDVAPHHEVLLAGDHPGQLPIDITGRAARRVFPVFFVVATHVLNVGTPIGRRARRAILGKPEPLIRVKPEHLDRAGVRRVARVEGVGGGLPRLADGGTVAVENVIWATGYRNDFGWIDLAVALDEHGEPVTQRGVVEAEPGLYFVGRDFLYAFSSHTVGGVGYDARHIVRHMVRHQVAREARGAVEV